MNATEQYNAMVNDILTKGRLSANRTGVKTKAIKGVSIRVDLQEEFPAVTCKRAFVRGGVGELNWMLSGSKSVLDLHTRNIFFWDQWAIQGEHERVRQLIDIKRDYLNKHPDGIWENAVAVTADLEELCKVYAIKYTETHDDRYVYRVPTVDDLVEYLVTKRRVADATQARCLIRGTWEQIPTMDTEITESRKDNRITQMGTSKPSSLETINQRLADHFNELDGDLYAEHCFDSILAWLIDKGAEVTRQNAINLIGCHESYDEVAKRLGVPKMVRVKTCEIGDLGPVYGHNWRNWKTSTGETVDQIKQIVKSLKQDPGSRRHVLSFWNVEHLPDERFTPQENVARGKMALAPCHWMTEFTVDLYTEEELRALLESPKWIDYSNQYFESRHELDFETLKASCKSRHIPLGKLTIHPHLRSWDTPAGAPVNLVFYATFCHYMAQQVCLDVGEMWMTALDAHVYEDQIEIMQEVITREARPAPQFKLTETPLDIFSYSDECYELIGYEPHPNTPVPVAL